MTRTDPQVVLKNLRARYTMTHGQVAAKFGLHRQSLRQQMQSGAIALNGVKFGTGATTPFMYDPKDVDRELAAYTKRLQAQVNDIEPDEPDAVQRMHEFLAGDDLA